MKYLFIPAMLACLCAVPAAAEEASDQVVVFDPAEFEQYAPLSARDMIERIPGFQLSNSRGQNEGRGFGQATENVLINGQRISSKSSSAGDVLGRIPAGTVLRIELLEGATLDVPGLSGRVVNVVVQANGISGTWAYRSRIIDGQEPFLFGGEMSVAGQIGHLGWNANLNIEPRGSSGEGEETITDALGAQISSAQLIQNNQFPNRNASLALQWTPPSGLIANLNAEYANERRERRENAGRVAITEPPIRQRTLIDDESTTVELGGDVEFDAMGGRLKLIGVYSDTESPFANDRIEFDASGTELQQSQFRQDTTEIEKIARAEYKWAAMGGLWDASIESAENTLKSAATLLGSSGGTPLAAIDIGNTEVSVEEFRNEAFLTYSDTLVPHVQVQISLGVENSEIQSSGPAGQTRSFTRPKGGMTLSYKHNEATTLNARVERSVGQLDFFDFVSQIDLNNGEDQIGNADIVPEQSWRGELELEREFGAWGAGNVLVFAEALEDIVDQVPIGMGEGPGNIDKGTRLGIEFEGTLNFDPLGLSGAQLIYSAAFRESQIDDPLTGETRAINGEELVAFDLEFRHDIAGTNFAWGGDVSPEREADTYRIDSIREKRDSPGRMSVYVEHKDLWGLTGRAEVFRPLMNIEKESRVRFLPDRTGIATEFERTRIEEKPILILELSGVF